MKIFEPNNVYLFDTHSIEYGNKSIRYDGCDSRKVFYEGIKPILYLLLAELVAASV